MFNNPAHANDGNSYTFGHFELSDDQERLRKSSYSLRSRILATSSAIAGVALLAMTLTFAILYFKKTSDSKTVTPSMVITSNITVYYAASLQDVMTRLINPNFTAQSSIGVKTVSGASGVLAKLLKGGAAADVFISADKKITSSLFDPVRLPNSTIPVLRWYTFWATTRLGIAYNTESPFVDTFEKIANGEIKWYKALDPNVGMRIGRTNPNLDPKGTEWAPLL
jgi:ABC-type molybdate transport system substrate-binding protein